jgi:hypothetical protein
MQKAQGSASHCCIAELIGVHNIIVLLHFL